MGLAEFALGHPDKAVEHLQRARELAPKKTDFAGILAPALVELGQIEQAKAAFKIFTEGRDDQYQLVRAVVVFPFLQRSVLDRLADGFENSGATAGIGGYMPLYAENRLKGSEIKSLLFGREIKGFDFWNNSRIWGQRRTADGKVEHLGFHIHSGVVRGDTGVGRIEDDMLCEQWPKLATALEVCVAIFRITEANARIRWGDYVMVTNTGPHPFRVVE